MWPAGFVAVDIAGGHRDTLTPQPPGCLHRGAWDREERWAGSPRSMNKHKYKLDADRVPREGAQMVPQDLSTKRTSTESWDPYDVWLTRVKQPRDRLPRPGDAGAPSLKPPDEMHGDDAHVDGGRLLPGVT